MKVNESTFIMLLGAIGILLTIVFLGHLAFRGLHRHPSTPQWEVPGGDAEKGRIVMIQYGCVACHVIPGIRTARGRVGPQLNDFRSQIYIAGSLPNTPENLVRWIYDPQSVRPGSAMPNLDLTEAQARDAAAYLWENP